MNRDHGIAAARTIRRTAPVLALLLAAACTGFEPPTLEALNPFVGRAAVAPDDPAVSRSPVGEEIARIRRALVDLRGQVADTDKAVASIGEELDAAEATYRGLRDAMNATLQTGTRPADPALLAQWREADAAVATADDRIAQLAARQPTVVQHAARAGELAERVAAARTKPGAVPEDAAQIDRLAGQVGETRVAIDRTQNGLADQIARRSATVAEERRTLSSLSLAIASGKLAAPDLAGRVAPGASAAPPRLAARETRRPLATIGFARPDVDYRQALYNAVSAAVDRSPGVGFDVIAVTPAAGEPAQQARTLAAARGNAERVAQSITGMGIPAGRVSLGARAEPGVGGNEVRVYVR